MCSVRGILECSVLSALDRGIKRCSYLINADFLSAVDVRRSFRLLELETWIGLSGTDGHDGGSARWLARTWNSGGIIRRVRTLAK